MPNQSGPSQTDASQPAVDGGSDKAAKDALEANGAIMKQKMNKNKAATGNPNQAEKSKPPYVLDPQNTPARFKLPIIR
ncbi:hypothetical protein CSUB01_06981 [Colletotrichum sublineola]|uniref:Uncharacterized protein n=1 Tax=Colletotrichum sublineola TaxID=1173701 RepID=A0A066WXR8_COLSU|nr:hypothetical protein CSUB01_06981 [Colletotrichum sublineola]